MARYRDIVIRLKDLIATHGLTAGQRLPAERELAELFQVSRTSVREAIRALAEQGVLESRQGDGTYVREHDPGALAQACSQVFAAHGRRLREIMEFRNILEPGLATLAAQRATAEDVARLKVLACDQQRLILTDEDDSPLDAAFHLQLARATGNHVLVDVLDALGAVLQQSRAEHLRGPERRRASQESHLRIIDAVEARAPEAARKAMEEHLRLVWLELLGEIEPDTGNTQW